MILFIHSALTRISSTNLFGHVLCGHPWIALDLGISLRWKTTRGKINDIYLPDKNLILVLQSKFVREFSNALQYWDFPLIIHRYHDHTNKDNNTSRLIDSLAITLCILRIPIASVLLPALE